MSTATLEANTTDYDVNDVEYLRHGDKPLLARVYKPRGQGPFPALVECHGGAWCMSDRTTEHLRHEYMAAHGIVSIALDFRSGNEAPYPASVQDINYAVRWAKLHARELKTRPELVAISGQSSGGHLAMLVAMRPRDPRYAAIALPAGSPRPAATSASTSATATRILTASPASGSATDSWSRSRESSLSIEHHRSPDRSRSVGSETAERIWSSCASAAAGTSGCSPRASIARRAMRSSSSWAGCVAGMAP